MLRKIILVLSGISTIAGFALIIGIAGSLDQNIMSFKSGFILSFIALLLISLGLIGFAKNPFYIEWD
jgi:hypothetical protein